MLDFINWMMILVTFLTGLCLGGALKARWLISKENRLDRKKMLERKAAFNRALEIINRPLIDDAQRQRQIERLKILTYIEGQRLSGGWTNQSPKIVFEHLRITIQNGVHVCDFDLRSAISDQEVL